FMAAFYVLGCVVILGINYDYIIPTVGVILRLAFTPGAAAGGIVGGGILIAARYGVARGLFSNESGLGSAPSWRQPPRRATRCARRSSPPPARSGTRSSSA